MHEINFKERLLLVLLLMISIIVRLQFVHPTDFDSYWIQGMAESINKYGYAKWVFHPASLFGYYPLSYPSGLMYFLSFFSEITGLNMENTIASTGVFLGVLGTFLIFIIGRKLGGFLTGFLSSLIFTTSPYIIYYSTLVASGRFFLIIFYMFFLIVLMKLLNIFRLEVNKEEENYISKKYPKLIFWNRQILKYSLLIILLLIYCFMIHRTAQLIVLFVISAIASYVYLIMPIVSKSLNKSNLFNRLIIQRYKKNNKLIILDVLSLAFILALMKAIDLLIRHRLLINIQRFVQKCSSHFEKLSEFYISNTVLFWIFICLLISVSGVIYIFIRFVKKIRPLKKLKEFYEELYIRILSQPEEYISYFLLFVTVVLFILSFFGKSFYSPSLEEYEASNLFKGDGPHIIFINFLINYHTGISPLAFFSFIGIAMIFLKKKKEPADIFLMFIILLFSGILIDKRYVRLFITPIIVIFLVQGLIFFKSKLSSLKYSTVIVPIFILICLIPIFINAYNQGLRFIFTEKEDIFSYKEEYTSTGKYLKSFNKEFSTITTDEMVAGVQIFASSGIPGSTHNVYYYVNKSYLQPIGLSFSEIKDIIFQGRKLERLWYLPDWIFGGEYYVGRHAKYLFGRSYFDGRVRRIVNDYNEKFYIHEKERVVSEFYKSITPILNKVYDNPLADVHDLDRGRV